MRLSSASRNDTDDFFPLLLTERMHDQQNRTRAYGSDRYPSLLIIKSEVALRKSEGIVENQNGSFKTNVVLAKVLPVLVLIPFKSHSRSRLEQNTISYRHCQYTCTYSSMNQRDRHHYFKVWEISNLQLW
jgi:hypothetical protein